MPTYVYKFTKTGETIEVQQAFTDDTLTKYKHPETGRQMAVRKVFQPVGVTFRGTGFFKNDNRGPASGDSSDSSSTDSSDSSSGSDSPSSTDTKSDGGSTTSKETSSSDSGTTPKKKDTAKTTAPKKKSS